MMTPRRSNDALSRAALRGVIEEPYTRRGCRVFISVDSTGEIVSERLVPRGQDSRYAEDELWRELDEVDPTQPHLSQPVLRLER